MHRVLLLVSLFVLISSSAQAQPAVDTAGAIEVRVFKSAL